MNHGNVVLTPDFSNLFGRLVLFAFLEPKCLFGAAVQIWSGVVGGHHL